VTDGQTGRRTDKRTVRITTANTALVSTAARAVKIVSRTKIALNESTKAFSAILV